MGHRLKNPYICIDMKPLLVLICLYWGTLNAQHTLAKVDTAATVCASDFGYLISGPFSGFLIAPHIQANTAVIQDARLHAKDVVFFEDVTLENTTIITYDCTPCIDNYIPGIFVLGDSCIRDDEWVSGGYSAALPDSAAFFSHAAIELFNSFGVMAVDDCAIDSFYVKELEIIPPGGVDRTPMDAKEFRILLRAVDTSGKAKEALMIWIRRDDNSCI